MAFFEAAYVIPRPADPPSAGVCHDAAVPELAVSTCPDAGAAAEDTTTVVVAVFSPDAAVAVAAFPDVSWFRVGTSAAWMAASVTWVRRTGALSRPSGAGERVDGGLLGGLPGAAAGDGDGG